MVTAATLVMIITMTFRLPYAAYGAIFALTLSRESLQATVGAVWMIVIGFVLAGVCIILGMMLARVILPSGSYGPGDSPFCAWLTLPLESPSVLQGRGSPTRCERAV
jgi:hypothetical protein